MSQSDLGSENSMTPNARIRFSRVLRIVGPCIFLFLACLAFFGFLDGTQWLADLLKPPLVPVRGEVFYQGKPLTNGQVTTQPLRPGRRGSVGFIEKDGRFELKTDIKGTYVPGAYAGEHKVIIAAYGVQAPASAPPLLTPESYASFATTPLTMTVHSNGDKNSVKFTLHDSVGAVQDKEKKAVASKEPVISEKIGPIEKGRTTPKEPNE